MDLIEQRGKIILLSIIGLLFTIELISSFIFLSPSSIFSFFLGVFFLWMMYQGYNWAKVVTIILLIIAIITCFVQIQEVPSNSWLFIYFIISICIYSISSIILIFSKSITEFMYSNRYR